MKILRWGVVGEKGEKIGKWSGTRRQEGEREVGKKEVESCERGGGKEVGSGKTKRTEVRRRK